MSDPDVPAEAPSDTVEVDSPAGDEAAEAAPATSGGVDRNTQYAVGTLVVLLAVVWLLAESDVLTGDAKWLLVLGVLTQAGVYNHAASGPVNVTSGGAWSTGGLPFGVGQFHHFARCSE